MDTCCAKGGSCWEKKQAELQTGENTATMNTVSFPQYNKERNSEATFETLCQGSNIYIPIMYHAIKGSNAENWIMYHAIKAGNWNHRHPRTATTTAHTYTARPLPVVCHREHAYSTSNSPTAMDNRAMPKQATHKPSRQQQHTDNL